MNFWPPLAEHLTKPSTKPSVEPWDNFWDYFWDYFLSILFQEGTSGPIGTAIKGLNENLQPFVDFAHIQTNVPILDRNIFAKQEELLMLLDLCHGIANGFHSIDQKYVLKKLFEISTVRWRTTWIRILRLYIQTLNPSPELIALVNFILKGHSKDPICQFSYIFFILG